MYPQSARTFHIICLLVLCLQIPAFSAQVTPPGGLSTDAQTVFTLAAELYPGLFSNGSALQTSSGYLYRYYASSKIYVGIKDGSVYVMGGQFGTVPRNLGTVSSVLTSLQATKSANSGTAFGSVIDLGTGSLPLRTQHAVVERQGEALVVMVDGTDLVLRDEHGSRYVVTTGVDARTAGPTVATNGTSVLVAWVTPTSVVVSTSTDLKTWSSPVSIGTRSEGGPIPCATWTGSTYAVAWMDVPRVNAATGAIDGVGPVQVATLGTGGWTVRTVVSTGAIVSISGNTVVWRDDRDFSKGLDSIRIAALDGSGEKVLWAGFDPAVWVDGSTIAIGYHIADAAHVSISRNGGTSWTDTLLDADGKFVAPVIAGGLVSAVWADYVDAAAANDARNDDGHKTTVWQEGSVRPLNGGAVQTLQGQAGVVAGKAVAVYQVAGRVYLAR